MLGLTEKKLYKALARPMNAVQVSEETGIPINAINVYAGQMEKRKLVKKTVQNGEVIYERGTAEVDIDEVYEFKKPESPAKQKEQPAIKKPATGNILNQKDRVYLFVKNNPDEEGHTYSEISKATGISLGSVQAAISPLVKEGMLVRKQLWGDHRKVAIFHPDYAPEEEHADKPDFLKEKNNKEDEVTENIPQFISHEHSHIEENAEEEALDNDIEDEETEEGEEEEVDISDYADTEAHVKIFMGDKKFEATGPAAMVDIWMDKFLNSVLGD